MAVANKQLSKTNQERIDLSDQLMFRAAIDLILEKGTEKTTLKEVGEKAGYSRGLAGYRFGSKSGLFSFVLQKLGDYWLRDLTKVSQDKKGLDAILASTKRHYELFEEQPNNAKVFYILWFQVAGVDKEFQELILKINQRRQEDVKQWILQDTGLSHKHQDAEVIASYFNSALNGMIYQWFLNPNDLQSLKKSHDDLSHIITTLLA